MTAPVRWPLVALATMLVCSAALAGALPGKELTLNLDFFDICIGTDAWDMSDHRGEMDRLMRLAAHYGVDRVLFRVSICGVVCYPSKVMYTADERCFAGRTEEMLDTPLGNLPSYLPNMAKLMQETDPLADCVEFGHKYGMEVWAWVTSYDSLYYALEGEFFHDNPQYTWVSRDGKDHIPGVPCYGYPQVRENRLAEIAELLEYDVDGVYLSMRSHSPWPTDRPGAREYGYNEPVIAEYRRRYGSDPREAARDSLEELRFVKLKGDFFKQFLHEAHGLCTASGKKLAMNASFDSVDPLTAVRMYIPADDLCREGAVDELCILEGTSSDLTRWRVLGKEKVKVTAWHTIHGATYEQSNARWRAGLLAALRNPTIDGVCFHEFANVVYLNMWDDIAGVVGEHGGN